MASLIRVGVSRLGSPSSVKGLLFAKNETNLVRCISGKLSRVVSEQKEKPKPWNYKERSYTLWNYMFDRTTARLDDNSKIVVVEGPIAAGKSKFAKELAEDLGMLYMPEANLDMIYINSYGYDLRQLDEQLPETCRSFDVKNFLMNPKHRLAASFQFKQYEVKFSQYIDALAHLLSTGQGVVLDRSVYSDFVFLEAMVNAGYVSKPARKLYYEIRDNTITELLRPHLVIYLDVSVNQIQENIKKRAIPYEQKSSVLTPEYLCYMERVYKQEYLKTIGKHAELLIYDWSDGGEVEIVVEDIERINFDKNDPHDRRFSDWDLPLEDDWGVARHTYADQKDFLMNYFNVPTYHVPELTVNAEDAKVYYQVIENAPGEQYEPGFNSGVGDKGVLLKLKAQHRETLPLRERAV